MTDPNTPGTSAPGAGDPGTTGQPPVTQPPPSQPMDWEARYKGMVKANSEKDQQVHSLTTKITELEGQIAALLGEKDTLKATWETKLGEANKNFLDLKQTKEKADQEATTTLAELTKLRALSQHPELMVYADLIHPTTDQEALTTQITKVQKIHADTLEAARKGLQVQGFAPPAAPPSTPPGAVTEATLNKAIEEAKEDLRLGKLTKDEFFRKTAEIGAQYNLLQQGKKGGQ